MSHNKYPIYIPSHSRADACKSALACEELGLDFTIVVEPSQYKAYRKNFHKDNIQMLAHDGMGIAYKRNKIIKMAKSGGHKAHWQIDDKVGKFYRRNSENKIVEVPIVKLITALEKEFDRYEDLAVIGPGITAFARKFTNDYSYSTFPYSCWLQRTENMPKFRPETLDDADYAMQLNLRGECVMRSNIYLRNTCTAGKTKGGNSVKSKRDIDALNEKVAKAVEYSEGMLVLAKDKRKDGVWDVKPIKRLSLLFPQRPTLKKR